MSCKNCKYYWDFFKEYQTVIAFPPNWFRDLLYKFQHVKGFCMDSENKCFNEFAKHFGRGLKWRDYIFKPKWCRKE